jgi:hypothetical protein
MYNTGTCFGIGTTTPKTSTIGLVSVNKLNVYGASAAGGDVIEGNNTSAAGTGFILANSSASNNYNAVEGVTYGTYSAIFGLHIPGAGTGYGGYFVTNSGSGIGLYSQAPTTTWAAYFNGYVYSTQVYQGSDRKLKTNIQPIESPLSKLLQLNGYTYDFKPELLDKYGLGTGKNIGIIADEVEKVFPELIRDTKLIAKQEGKPGQKANPEEGMDIKAVNYTGLIPVLIEAIKEQQKMIDILKQQNQELEKRIANLEHK